MNFFDEEKVNKILLIIIILLQIITISVVVLCSDCYMKENEESNTSNIAVVDGISSSEEVIEKISNIVRVDIKGAVKNPGVYEVDSDSRVIDVINLAGGLKSNASTKYLNLSKKITDEMIINVYTNTQIKNMNIEADIKEECSCPSIDTSSCAGSSVISVGENSDNTASNTSNSDSSDNKVSINNGSKEELMTLSGIGESKAEAIIEYRNINNGFKTLEDIMNVSGIGEAAYNKIKDSITL